MKTVLAIILLSFLSGCAHPGDRRNILDQPETTVRWYPGSIQERNELRAAVYGADHCSKFPGFCQVVKP